MDTAIHKASAAHVDAVDKYTASIELSNACRQFYKSRVEAADCIKSRWEKQAHESRSRTNNDNDRPADDNSNNSSQKRQRSSIDDAMDKLRAEMTSLMDQDLSLMKQLLTLNETIEDLKWQRRYYFSSRSSADDSDCSISDTEMCESEDDLLFLPPSTTPCTTTTDATTTLSSSSSCRKHSLTAYKGEKRCLDTEVVVSESAVKVYHSEQDSFDSGIHESCSEEEALEASV